MTLHKYPAAAKLLGVSERTLDRLVSERQIQVTHVRSACRISDEEIDRFIKANTGKVVSITQRRSR